MAKIHFLKIQMILKSSQKFPYTEIFGGRRTPGEVKKSQAEYLSAQKSGRSIHW